MRRLLDLLGDTLRAGDMVCCSGSIIPGAPGDLYATVSRMAAASPSAETPISDAKIQQALSYINENFRSPLTVEQLAERVYLSRYHFMRLFKAQTGTTVYAYVRQKRLMCAARSTCAR